MEDVSFILFRNLTNFVADCNQATLDALNNNNLGAANSYVLKATRAQLAAQKMWDIPWTSVDRIMALLEKEAITLLQAIDHIVDYVPN